MIDTISGFLKEYEKEQSVIDARKYYEDLLTTGIDSAQQQYQASTQKAAEQASYDISGAYANYLKQQRNAMSQGRLESGYKEELGDVLQQQYQSAYSQARAAQEQDVTAAYDTYTKNVATLKQAEEKSQTDITTALTERAQRASQFQELVWKQYGITDPEKQLTSSRYDSTQGLYPVYAKDKTTGEYTLTDFGKDWVQRAMLQGVQDSKGNVVKFEDWLREEDEKAYETYKTHYGEIIKDVGELEYEQDENGNYLLPEYKETAGKETRLKTEGYIESISKPSSTLDLNINDFGLVDWGKSGKSKITESVDGLIGPTGYGNELGLSEQETVTAIRNKLQTFDPKWVDEHYHSRTGEDAVNYAIETFINSSGSADDLYVLLKDLSQKKDRSFVDHVWNELINAVYNAGYNKYRGA